MPIIPFWTQAEGGPGPQPQPSRAVLQAGIAHGDGVQVQPGQSRLGVAA